MASNIQTITDVSKWKLFAKFQNYHRTRTDWTHLTGFIFVPKITSMNASLSFQWMRPFRFNECIPFISMNAFLSFQWMRPFHFNECVPFISMNASLSFQWMRPFHFNECVPFISMNASLSFQWMNHGLKSSHSYDNQ
jgi:hypothetical protein